MNHFFAYINRMRFIQRWSLMRNSYTENIQEHSHQTAVLAHALAVLRNERFGGQVDVGAVAVAALYHDAGEILTGDMPTPIKYYNPGIREAYKAVEQVAEDKLLSMLPEDLRPAYEDALRPADPEIEQLVRAADKLSAHIKCIEELKAGNTEFRQAAAQTAAAHESCEYRSADGIDNSDANTCEHGRDRQWELDHQDAVWFAHAHAASGFLYTGIDLLQSQAGIADDGQKRLKCDAYDHGDFSSSEKDHNDAKHGQ